MKEYKVLHIYSSWTSGGAEKILLSLAAGLEQRGWKNAVAAPRDSYLYAQALKQGLRAHHISVRGTFDLVGFVQLLRVVRAEKPDILHAHQGKVFWPCIFIKWFMRGKVKVVFHRHAHLRHRWYSRVHYRWADRAIAVSRVVARDLQLLEKVPAAKIRVVYNGTDFRRFSPSVSGETVRAQYGLGGRPVIGTVAAMNRPKGKGQEYLIEAAQIVRVRFPDAAYLVIGDGPIRGELEKLSGMLGVGDRVIFTGHRDDVEKYIAAMDVFCFLPWDREGFGQVMVEAQGMGKPVIGTDIGGVPETFRDGETGFLIRSRDSESLAQCIVALLDDAVKRRQMGQAAAQFAASTFNYDAMIDNIIAVYHELFN
jgi:glycosyltransferase involved in cell wall biosynthesis